MHLQLLSGTFSKASCCCGGKSGTDWAVTTNEVIEHGNTKVRAPSVRPGQLQIHTANGSVPSLCVLQKEERGGYSSFQKALFPLESSPFLYAFPEAEMFALTLEQPFLQDKEEECDFFFSEKRKRWRAVGGEGWRQKFVLHFVTQKWQRWQRLYYQHVVFVPTLFSSGGQIDWWIVQFSPVLHFSSPAVGSPFSASITLDN